MQEDRISKLPFDRTGELPEEGFERVQDRGHPDLEFKRIIDENKNKKFQKHLEQKELEENLLKQALDNLGQTDDGYRFLRWLCNHLAFKDSVLAMVNGHVETDSMIFNEARRLVWRDIRNLMSTKVRNKIEEDN